MKFKIRICLIFSIIILVVIISVPAFATQWVRQGNDIYIEKNSYDSINDNSERLDIVRQFTNKKKLQIYQKIAKTPSEISACLIEHIYDCKNDKAFLQAVLCYDLSGNVVYDKVYEDVPKNWVNDNFSCKLIKDQKARDVKNYNNQNRLNN